MDWRRSHRHAARGRALRTRRTGTTGVSPVAREGRNLLRPHPPPTPLTHGRVALPRDRYGSTTSTLKNRMVGRAVPGEPPPTATSPHGPSSVAAPFTTARAPGTLHYA
ncbi:MAG: hypothetical protein IJL17_23175 [Kiritimatiellae bacterium]|nr:hypothetical protein [Kiritimatiellia bacterium]